MIMIISLLYIVILDQNEAILYVYVYPIFTGAHRYNIAVKASVWDVDSLDTNSGKYTNRNVWSRTGISTAYLTVFPIIIDTCPSVAYTEQSDIFEQS